MRNPCKKKCPEWTATCHAECERYLEYAAWCAERRKHTQKESEVYNYIRDAVAASKRREK